MHRIYSLFVALVLISAVAWAQQPRRGMHPGSSIDKLQLTEQQKPEFEKLQAEHLKKMIDRRAKVASAEVDLRMLFHAEAPQKAAIEKKINEIAELRTQTAVARLDHWFAVQKILTADQQKAWKATLRQQRHMKHGRQSGLQDHPGVMRGRGMMMSNPSKSR